MNEPLPVVLVPGLLASARLYTAQIPALWRAGAVQIADHTRHASLQAIARSILAAAPPRFALAGLSMGGYLAFEILRQAPERIGRLALLDTSARPDTPEQSAVRREQMAGAAGGRFAALAAEAFARMLHPARRADAALLEIGRLMAQETGPEAFVRQQSAIIERPDSRPLLTDIRCPTLVLVGENDPLTPPERAAEIAGGIPGARLVAVPDCGHLSTLEQPEAVTHALHEWLQL